MGHFDYNNTGCYAIASSATIHAAAGQQPDGPALARHLLTSGQRTPLELGRLLVTATRLSTALLAMLGIPFLFLGFPLLRIWVGVKYASHALIYLEVLVAANIVRQLAYPYALMVVGLGRQRSATVSPVLEAIVNSCQHSAGALWGHRRRRRHAWAIAGVIAHLSSAGLERGLRSWSSGCVSCAKA